MRRGAIGVALGIAAIAALHYTAGHDSGDSPHHLYRRLFYLPILAAAWLGGRRGGLLAAGSVIAVYAPHAFGWWGLHQDPASMIDKVAEMLLYAGLGGLVGLFVDRERGNAHRLGGLLAERGEALDRLRAAQEQLVLAENHAALGFLSAGLAHEIRNPLASIRGGVEILRDGAAAEHARVADVVVRETERLDGVLTRFLEFAGRQPATTSPTSIPAVVAEVLTLVAAEARSRGVAIEHEPGEVPVVALDAGRLRQVLLNLVINAMQVQPQGGAVRVICGVDARDAHRPLFVRVEDRGPGVPEADRRAIFHPYWSRRPGGTGLGLSIAWRAVGDSGGVLLVGDSSLGGASFEVRLPMEVPR